MGIDGPAQLVVTGCWRIGENFPAFKYTMATGTDIHTLWKGYLSREVRDLASTDIRYIEEVIKTESGMTNCFSYTLVPCFVTLLFPFSFSNTMSPSTGPCCRELPK